MIVQYIMVGYKGKNKFSEIHRQNFRPMKGDTYFAKLESGEIVKTRVTDIVVNPGTLPECKDTPVEILVSVE